MGKSQIIHTDGEDLVVIPRSDYEALLARAGDEASEDAATARIIAATDAKIARGEDVALPAAVWAAIESGEHPVSRDPQIPRPHANGRRQGGRSSPRLYCRHRGRRERGSADSLKAIAAALAVSLDIIVG